MDMSSMSMATSTLGSATMTMASAAASSTSTATSGMSMGGTCKISMTWNWYTVGACFISKTWQVTSSGMFAGSCIGVICLVISLEFLRRVQREYDGYIRRQDTKAYAAVANRTNSSPSSSNHEVEAGKIASVESRTLATPTSPRPHIKRVTLLQRQVFRALLHMVQFGVAYFVMLLAMYYNGYIIICILIGAFLGAFIFSWDQLVNEINQKPEAADVTGCCG